MFAEIYTSFEQQQLREGACDALHFKHLFMYIQVTVKKKERAENTETAREREGGREGGVAGHRFVSAVFVQFCYILHKPGQFSCGLHFICTT